MNILKWLLSLGNSPKSGKQSTSLQPQTYSVETKHMLQEKRMEHRERRYTNRSAIWPLFLVMKQIDDLREWTDIDYGNYKDIVKNITATLSIIRENPPSDYQYLLAYRLAGIKYAQGECRRRVSLEEIKAIDKWEPNPDYEIYYILRDLYNFDVYWDSVLNSYKRPAARIKRLKYLIDSMDSFLQNSEYNRFPQAISRIESLRSKYVALLDKADISTPRKGAKESVE